jgi:hypothetical protein
MQELAGLGSASVQEKEPSHHDRLDNHDVGTAFRSAATRAPGHDGSSDRVFEVRAAMRDGDRLRLSPTAGPQM